MSASNYPHHLPFVIQGYNSSIGKWQDSKHGGQTREQAETYATAHAKNFAMPGTRLRIVPAISIKEAAK